MRRNCRLLLLPFLFLLVGSSLYGADNSSWSDLKQLNRGQNIRLILNSNQAFKGEFQSIDDENIVVQVNGTIQTFTRLSVQRVSSRRPGHRGRNALIGGVIGAVAGLGTGAAIDNDCSRNSIVCSGNKGKAILTPALGVVGAVIGAFLPTGGWHEIYRAH